MYVIRWSTSLLRRSQSHNAVAHLSENPWMWLLRQTPPWISTSPPRAMSHFSRANHRRWRGQRAPLDVLQLPMGNVSPSHRRGITNSLLSVLTSDGGCSKLTSPAVHRELCMTWERTASCYLWNLSHRVLEDILTRVSRAFHHVPQVMQSVPTSRVINRKGLTLFTFSLRAEHRNTLFMSQYSSREVNHFSDWIQHFTS